MSNRTARFRSGYADFAIDDTDLGVFDHDTDEWLDLDIPDHVQAAMQTLYTWACAVETQHEQVSGH